MAFVDPHLPLIRDRLKDTVPIPTLINSRDTITRALLQEIQDIGAGLFFVSDATDFLGFDIPNQDLDQVIDNPGVEQVWYDRPHYAFQTPSPDDISKEELKRLLQRRDSPFRSDEAELSQRLRRRTDLSDTVPNSEFVFTGMAGPEEVPTDRTTFTTATDQAFFTNSIQLANDHGLTGDGATVAVLDTGVDPTHPMLQDAVKDTYSFVPEPPDSDFSGHGTWVCSSVAGRPIQYDGRIASLRGKTLHGHAPDADLISIKVLTGEGCLTGSTWVKRPDGWTQIWRLKEGDTVISLNLDTMQFEEDEVVKTWERNSDNVYRVTFEEGHTLLATGNHPFLVEGVVEGDRSWVRADELEPGMSVVGSDVDDMHRVPQTYQVHKARDPVPSGEEHWQGVEKVEKECTVCGKTEKLIPSRAERGEFKYCSNDCRAEALKNEENNPLPPPEERQFEKGHTPWNKGVPRSDETRGKVSEALQEAWSRGAFEDKEYPDDFNPSPDTQFKEGDEPWNKDITLSETQKLKVARATQAAMKRDDVRANMREAYRRVQDEGSQHEHILKDALEAQGLTPHFQYPYDLPNHDAQTVIDLAFPDAQIAIYVDGTYWHDHPYGKEKDHLVNESLESDGWTILRYWHHELEERLDDCVKEITGHLASTPVDPVVKSVEKVNRTCTVYDLTLEKNHNFVANGLVVHNSGFTSDIILGIDKAIELGVDVMNLSLGTPGNTPGTDPAEQAVNNAFETGVVPVVAAGNFWGWATIGSPASARNALAVGATAMETPAPRRVSTFSSKGPETTGEIKPDIAAPGGNAGGDSEGPLNEVILSASSGTIAEQVGERFGLLRGTSMAAPSMSGVLAQLATVGFPEDRDAWSAVLAESVQEPRVVPFKNNRKGWGTVDAVKLLQALESGVSGPLQRVLSRQGKRRRPVTGRVVKALSEFQPLPVPDPDAVRIGLV